MVKFGNLKTSKKNGRQGNSQDGVDIYGIPEKRKNYWGIQCKGKDDYSDKELSEKEINIEIKKALRFRPKLEKFIFATTANKNSKIEKFIRKKNLYYRKHRNLCIDINSWEDIVDLIEINKHTYNSYVKGKHFISSHDFEIIINYDKAPEIRPKFIKDIIYYKEKRVKINLGLENALKVGAHVIEAKVKSDYIDRNADKSWCEIIIKLNNIGNETIEDWNIELVFEGNINELRTDLNGDYGIIGHPNYYSEKNTVFYFSQKSLVQKDFLTFVVYVKPHASKRGIKINWNILARDFNKNGICILKVNPEYVTNKSTYETDNKKLLSEKKRINITEFKEQKETYGDF